MLMFRPGSTGFDHALVACDVTQYTSVWIWLLMGGIWVKSQAPKCVNKARRSGSKRWSLFQNVAPK